MAKIWLTKTPDGNFAPATEDDAESFKRYAIGSIFEAEVKFKRHGKHHRLGMVLLRYVFSNQDRYEIFETFLTEVKILTGYVDTHISLDGTISFKVKSIAFDQMDEIDFGKWKSDALTAVFDRFIPQMSEKDQERVINHLLANC